MTDDGPDTDELYGDDPDEYLFPERSPSPAERCRDCGAVTLGAAE